MDIFQWEQNPWGQDVLVRISWDLLYAAILAGVVFVIAHLIVRKVWTPSPVAAGAGADADVPAKVSKHSGAARAFHWAMALSMFALLITGFFPILGIRFDWVTIHWVAGLVLIGTVIFHIGHTTVRGTWRQVAVERADIDDAKRRIAHALGRPAEPVGREPKYPLPNKLYHHVIVLASVLAIGTGLLMMVRVETPFWSRNPYLLGEQTWGWVYVVHGLASVGLVTLVIAHVYFAILPEKRWMTRAMIRGWITRNEYLDHHDPQRWDAAE